MDGSIVDQFDAADPDAASEDPNILHIDIDVTFQKKRFTSLDLQEPKVKQIERAELELNMVNPTPYNFRRYQIALIAAVAKVPIEVVGELPNSVMRRAWDFLRQRLEPGSPEIGET